MHVVPVQIVGNVRAGRAHAVIGLQVHPFVFDAAPHTLNEHVIAPSATPVHGQLAAPAQHHFSEVDGSELATLVRIDDLGCPVPGKGLLDHFPGVTGFQRAGYLVRQHAARRYVHHGGEVDESARHGDVGRVQRPDLVGAVSGQLKCRYG